MEGLAVAAGPKIVTISATYLKAHSTVFEPTDEGARRGDRSAGQGGMDTKPQAIPDADEQC